MRWKNTISIFIYSGLLAILSACGGGGSSEPKLGGPITSPPPSAGPTAEEQVVQMRLDYNEVEGLRTLADFPIGTEVSAADQKNSIFIVTDQQPVLAHHFSNLVAGSIMKSPTLHPQEDE